MPQPYFGSAYAQKRSDQRGSGSPMRIFRRFVRQQSGAIALEMALVGPPFFLILLTIIDLGLMLANQSLLDGAARDAARLIRTGQVQSATSPITTFQNLLC